MSEQRLTTETETEIKWRAQFANVPDDIRALLAEVEALRQERNEARAILAHVADKLDSILESGEIDYLSLVGLAMLKLEARLAAEGAGRERRD